MQKNRLLTGALILFLMIIVSSCGIEKISRKKIKDIDFTVVAEGDKLASAARLRGYKKIHTLFLLAEDSGG